MMNEQLGGGRSRRGGSRRADARVLRDLASCAVIEPYRPIIAHLVVTVRCNLSCGYCDEYDHVSEPVPLAALRERIDHLARLRTVFVALTGGESLLHPEIARVVAHVRARNMTPVMNTNGYLLTEARIRALNRAGLYAMQLSIDSVTPNETTAKSLRPLWPKLRRLAEHAAFRVRVNTVLGAGAPDEALEVARAVTALGFEAKCSLLRDRRGQPVPQSAHARRVYDEIRRLDRRSRAYLSERFQLSILREGQVSWKCRAGARTFHVCENGLVHLCTPRFGEPGVPLADYGEADIRRAFHMPKSCAPTCPVAYAHQASRLDRFRPQSAPAAGRGPGPAESGRVHLPVVP